ncbi:undecaprenyl-phosphate glucose phosphotransferase [Caldimonas sp.]|uniref:undecaprenyl-phosphate glucose phosphotransferase n=1 Tax=Caldimonas sp. TaxID=2838790 RepID=UPI0039197A6B
MPRNRMFDDRNSHKRTFFGAPQSVTSMVAAVLEPGLMVLSLLLAYAWFDQPVGRPELVLSLLVFALAFPGRDRFRDNLLAAATDIALSWFTLMAIFGLLGYATSSFGLFDTRALLLWALATPVLQWLSVWAGAHIVNHHANLPRSRRSAVVVGAGPLGEKVSRALAERRDRGIDFLGYFDDRTDDRLHEGAAPHRLGTLSDVGAYVSAHGVRDVYITLPLGSQPRIVRLLEQLQGTTASLYYVPDVFGISIIQGRLQDMGGVPVVGICETPFTGTNELVKRLSDIVMASVILVLISPLMLVIALGVKLSSPGPVIFKQRRNGLDGEEIVVYKFRTMRVLEDGPVVKQATKDDPRITPFGAFLRRTSLDELPQFINVLQGRMSIVGPRPHAVAHNEAYRRLIKAYMVRHKVRPGITGWAQVHGYRGETEVIEKMQARVEYDLEYLRNWSLGLDLQIIARTIRLMLFDRHAY